MSVRMHNCPRCGPVIQDDWDSICCPACGDGPAESGPSGRTGSEAYTAEGKETRDDLKSLLTEAQSRATADTELLAEAVRLLEPFGRLSAKLADEGVLVEVCRPHPDNPSRRIEPFLTKHLRAAAAFLSAHKLPGAGESEQDGGEA